MRKVFAKTKNVDDLFAALDVVTDAEPGHRMCLLYGEYGSGKTQTVAKVAIDRDYTYVRAKKHMTTKSLLATISRELGIPAEGTADVLYNRICEELKGRDNHALIVDEIDYLVKEGRVLTLMDLHDESNSPVIMVGMAQAHIHLQKFPHLLDRCSAIVEFTKLTESDLSKISAQMCEVALDATAVKFIHEQTRGRFRRIMVWFKRAERAAKVNSLKSVTNEHLQKLQKGKNGK